MNATAVMPWYIGFLTRLRSNNHLRDNEAKVESKEYIPEQDYFALMPGSQFELLVPNNNEFIQVHTQIEYFVLISLHNGKKVSHELPKKRFDELAIGDTIIVDYHTNFFGKVIIDRIL